MAEAKHGEATMMTSSSDEEDHPVSREDEESLVGSSSGDRYQNMDLVDGEEIIGPPVRPGPTPTVAGSAGAPEQDSAGDDVVGFQFEPADDLSEQDAVEAKQLSTMTTLRATGLSLNKNSRNFATK
jgi:hypothetical protein